MIGKTISHYRIIEQLGEGGMGVVYKARDTRLNRFVAVKVLPADKTANPVRKQRFMQEAQAASALNHPNIITIHEISSEDGTDFIVMEFVEGKTLDRLIPARGLALGEALQFREGVMVEFRAEAFNAFNSTQFGQPTSNLCNSNFGRVTSAGGERQLPLGLKLYF